MGGSFVFFRSPRPLYLERFLKYFRKKESKSADFLNNSDDRANICIVGAGFSGLCMGVKLKKAGFKFRILEKGSGVGGTWTANQYPGCRCDVWSVLYQV